MISNISYWHTLKQLLIRGFLVYRPQFKHKIINSLIFTTINVIVFAYFMPAAGLENYGSFIVASLAASCSLFATMNNIVQLISDICDETGRLQYELTLPIPQWLVFFKYTLENMYQAFILSFLILPYGSLLIMHQMNFAHLSFVKFYFMLLISSFFFGNFSVLIASMTQDIYNGLENAWLRVIVPMWFLGCYQFSWQHLYTISPTLAYFNLLNPLTYALEGSRASVLDPSLSLPYWPCVFILLIFSILFGYVGIKLLQKRLDCL